MISIDYNSVFETSFGKKVYKSVETAILENGFDEHLKKGVLVGFSGGADSVMLLLALKKYASIHGEFKICAMHINHMIRGAEADMDEELSGAIAKALDVEFISKKIDIPRLSREIGTGTEETARNERYKAFNEIISGRNDLSTIAVAHNSTDNLETVIFNMLRGAGTRGASGIPPHRDNIIRPLLYATKEDIIIALKMCSVPFASDSTNNMVDYTRNFIRIIVLPKLREISNSPEESVRRLSKNLRTDDEFIRGLAFNFLAKNLIDGRIKSSLLSELHPTVRARVITFMAKEKDIGCEYYHIDKINSLFDKSTDFSISLPGRLSFVVREGYAYIGEPVIDEIEPYFQKLEIGINTVKGIAGAIIVSDSPITNSYSNVYRISIQQAIPRDIINGGIYVRSKLDGDSYSYGGMTHKLKKIFNDKSIPPKYRPLIPIIADDSGILWVPGLPIRQADEPSCSSDKLYVALAYNLDTLEDNETVRLYKANEWQ